MLCLGVTHAMADSYLPENCTEVFYGANSTANNSLSVGSNSIGTVQSNASSSFTFAPTQTGFYTLTANYDGIQLSVKKDGNTLDEKWTSCSLELSAGTTYTVVVYNATESPLDISLTITKSPSLSFGNNNGLSFPVTSGPMFYATFTPTESGSYKFVVAPSSVGMLIYNTHDIYSSSTNPIASSDNNGEAIAINLVADQTYYIFIINTSATSGSINISEYDNPNVLKTEVNTVNIYKNDGSLTDPKYYYTFQPLGDGLYTFNFSEPVNAQLSNASGIVGYQTVQGGLTMTTQGLLASETYTLKLDGGDNDYSDATITIGFELIVSALGYSTLYLGYDAVIPEGLSVFAPTLSADGQTLIFGQPLEGVIPANTGCIVKGEKDQKCIFTASSTPAIEKESCLSGTLHNINDVNTLGGKVYVLSKEDDQVGFYRYKGSLGANKAFLLIPEGQSAPSRISFDEDEEGLGSISNDDEIQTIFNLQGQLLDKITKPGIYVVGGKTIMVK